MSIPLRLPVLASSPCMLFFCLWDCLGAHCSFMQKFCLASSTLGQIAPEAGGGDAWILTSFLGLLCPLGLYSMGLYPLDRPKSAVLTYTVVNLLFTLLPPFRTSNSTISLSLLPLTLILQWSPPCWQVGEHLSSAPLSLGWRSWHIPRTFRIACVLLCCPTCVCWGGWSSPWGPSQLRQKQKLSRGAWWDAKIFSLLQKFTCLHIFNWNLT